MIFFIYILILFGYVFNRGFYGFTSFLSLLTGFLLLGIFVIRGQFVYQTTIQLYQLRLILFLQILLSFLLYGLLYQQNPALARVSIIFLFLELLIYIYYFLAKAISGRFLFRIFIFAGLVLRIFVLIQSPQPMIDVFDFLKYGASDFMSGINPYSAVYSRMYVGVVPNYYTYFPGTLILTLMPSVFFGDPRWAMLIAEIGSAILVRFLRRDETGLIISLILITNPMTYFILEQSYTESLLLFFMMLFLVFIKRRNFFSLGIVLGILLALKQYMVVMVPLFFFLEKGLWRIREYFIPLLVFFLLVGPFLIWNFGAFVNDAIIFHFSGPSRLDGLTFYSFLNDVFEWQIPTIFGFVVVGVGSFIFFLNRSVLTAYQFFLYGALFLFSVFIFGKQAFANYYYLVSQMLLLYLLALPQKSHA